MRKAGFDPIVVDVRCFALRNILKTMPEVADISTKVFVEISGQENYAVCMQDGLPFIYDIYVTEDDANFLVEGGDKVKVYFFLYLFLLFAKKLNTQKFLQIN